MRLIGFILFVLSLFCSVKGSLSEDELYKLQSKGVIYLNSENYKEILYGPRDYYISLLFTSTDPIHKCEPCTKFDPNYRNVANSYYTSNPGKFAIFFFIVEFNDNQGLFNELKFTNVPNLILLPPITKKTTNILKNHLTYKLTDNSLEDILKFATYISKITGSNIIVDSPFDPVVFGSYFFGTFFLVLLLKKKVIKKVNSRETFKYLSTIFIIVLTCGYMFTSIRGIPFISKNEKNEIMYFSGGTHWQFGTETLIVGAIYFILVLFIYALIIKVPKFDDEKRKFILTIGINFAIFYMFNLLTSIFKIKDPSYPYQLTTWF